MVIYTCNKCRMVFNKKSNYSKHLERKYSCSNINNIFTCEYCNYECETIGLLNKHLKDRCKIKKDLEDDTNQVYEDKNKFKMLEEELKMLKEMLKEHFNNTTNSHNNTTNTNSTDNSYNTTNSNNTLNNITNNINNNYIVNFGKEDIDRLSKQDKIDILKSSYGCIIKCLQLVNLNPLIPEQMNVYIADLKSKHSYKYEEDDFKATNTNELLVEILQNRANDVRDLIDQNDELGVENKYIERCGKRIGHIDNENIIEIDKVKNEARYKIFNSKKMILENKNKIKNK